jgi:uncharacterized protein YukJ
MALANYSVLKGDPQSGRVAFNREGGNPHFQITLQAGGSTLEAAVNIQSDDGSEVLYLVDHGFMPPDPAGLKALAMGIHALQSAPGGLALDFVREQVNGSALVERDSMSLLPKSFPAGHRRNDLNNEVVDLLNRAVQDPDGTMYIFGDAFADGGETPTGIHDIHMNQGNPQGSHSQDNGVWQDGALFVNLPAQNDAWLAVFIAFQTESWQTDDQGDPLEAAGAAGH